MNARKAAKYYKKQYKELKSLISVELMQPHITYVTKYAETYCAVMSFDKMTGEIPEEIKIDETRRNLLSQLKNNVECRLIDSNPYKDTYEARISIFR